MVWACWCGHTQEQHKRRLIESPPPLECFFAHYECMFCGGRCDEWQEEFCKFTERTPEHDKRL